MVKNEILRLWKELVVATGATKPSSDDIDYIYSTWCPENTLDAKFQSERRPELKEILHQSLNGELSDEEFNSQITSKSEFKRLMNKVHHNITQIHDEELFKWSRDNVRGVKKEMWLDIGAESTRHLRVSLSRYLSFEKKMNELDNNMKKWMQEYSYNLNNLIELVEANTDLPLEKHKKQLELSETRLNEVNIIRGKLPNLIDDPIHGLKNKMREEVIDAIFSGSALSEIPDWASEIDAVSVEQSMDIMNKFMELEIETPRHKIDKLMVKLKEIMNGPVAEILLELSKLTSTEWN